MSTIRKGGGWAARAVGISTVIAIFLAAAQPVPAMDVSFWSFSRSAAIGPPADSYGARLSTLSETVLGKTGRVTFTRYSPAPAIPGEFKGIVEAVGAGGPLAGGKGFDAAYISGSDLNKGWGFLYNSGVPFGPEFDEFLGFLYGRSVDDGTRSGLDMLQELLDRNGSNVVAVPIVGSSHQGSGYFLEPVGDAGGKPGIGLAGLCQKTWTFRYLPPAQYVLDRACDDLVAKGVIPKKNITFVTAVAGGGSLVKGVADNKLQAYEFATPLDDHSQLFGLPEGNPGTVGTRFLHFPGWHQQFLITYMIINKKVWNMMTPAQQALVMSAGRESVVTSYAENLRQQGMKLREILTANDGDADPANDMVLAAWPEKDLALLRNAAIAFLNSRTTDTALRDQDRKDYGRVLEALRTYVNANSAYWKVRSVPDSLRFQGWNDPSGRQPWDQKLK
ncbi:MAG: type 2 periplasmic-binding domain-containing protein [Nitrospirota bacterium]